MFNYDRETAKKIREQIHALIGEDAADLVARLLHPDPTCRPISMGEVLRHQYFHSSTMR